MPATNKVLIPLLILAHLCVHGVLLVMRSHGGLENAELARGLLFAEVPLVAMWLAWGRTNFLLRLGAAVATVYGAGLFFAVYDPYQYLSGDYGYCCGTLDDPVNYEEYHLHGAVGAALFLALIVGLPLFVSRYFGAIVCHDGELAAHAELEAEHKDWQFSIWHLFCATTLVAIAIPVFRFADFSWLNTNHAAEQGGVIAAGTLATAVVVLRARRWELALFGVIMLVVAEYCLHSSVLSSVSGYPRMFSFRLALTQLLATSVTVLIVRLAGYRLYWPAILAKPTAVENG